MNYDKKILKRFDEIIELGEKVLATRRSRPSNVIGPDRVDDSIAYRWIPSVQNLINRVFGSDSPHAKNIDNEILNGITYPKAIRIHGVVNSAKDDYEAETLFDLKELITANLFEDFLEQAEMLIEAQYHQPAAVIIGSVLEDGLRKLCEKHEITLPAKPKIDSMNAELARNGIYNKLKQKNITAYADLRNNAAHGNWDQFNVEDVTDFLEWTRRFMSEYFE